MAHPLLISLANIFMDSRTKASNHLFLLLALLPIPRFLHKNRKTRGVLESRLFHQCLDIILAPLKKVAEIGAMMADPVGNRRFCFTPLAAYIVDTPESALIAGVGGKTSSVTMAFYKQFGDDFQHEPRTASTTLAQLQVIESKANPWNLDAYIAASANFRLNGVHRPFWRNYPLSDPSSFLTPEPLHHWHKQFWDHDAKWCINAIGGSELDFRFSVLHPHAGFRHFKEGISSLKQVTGREHRDVQRYIVSVIAGATSPQVVIAIRSLLDFRYLAQARVITEETCLKILSSLQQFHDNKQAIIAAEIRRGKGKSVIKDWYIPKLEFMQSVVSNIRLNGVAIQWSADITERAHITVIKDPADSANNQNYEPQICRFLDRNDKLRQFDLATAIKSANLNPLSGIDDSNPAELNSKENSAIDLLAEIELGSPIIGPTSHRLVDYFDIASQTAKTSNSLLLPYRTMESSPYSAFHLTRDPSYKRMSVDEVAALYHLPDLRSAIGDYFLRASNTGGPFSIGGRRISQESCTLLSELLEVWTHFRLQTKAYHEPHETMPSHTINAHPPTSEWPLGHFDTVIINSDSTKQWPFCGLEGFFLLFHTAISTLIYNYFRSSYC